MQSTMLYSIWIINLFNGEKTAKCKQSPVQQQLNKDNSDMEL